MSANATATARIAIGVKTVPDAERGHRVRLSGLYILAIATNFAIFIYGFEIGRASCRERV